MENWLIGLLVIIGAFIIGFFIEPVRDFYEEAWETIINALSYIISFEWFADIGEVFSSAWEALTNLGESPLINPWFWVFYVCLMAGVWYLPSAIGLADYTITEKIMYTVIFLIVDWIIVSFISNG